MKNIDASWAVEIEGLIRSGAFEKARKRLEDESEKRKARPELLLVANFFRRLGQPLDAVRVLNRIVRPPPRSPIKASVEEKTEYAAALIEIGGNREAVEILANLERADYAPAMLIEAFAHIGQWNYTAALPLLRDYVRHPSLSEYQMVVGKVNLLSALCYENLFAEAEKLMPELVKQSHAQDSKLLEAAALETCAEAHVMTGRYQEARRDFELVQGLLQDSKGVLSYQLRKWKAACDLYENPGNAAHAKALEQVREDAREAGYWEMVRDCDYHLARALKSEALFKHLYFGTPYETYRKRLHGKFAESVGERATFPGDTYSWSLGEGKAAPVTVDVNQGKSSQGGEPLKSGQLPQRLLGVLCGDFYKPISVASVHAQLFPDRYYNPTVSPESVRNVSVRLSAWLDESKIPLSINRSTGVYRLEANGKVELVVTSTEIVPADVTIDPKLREYLPQLRNAFGEEAFTTLQAAECLRLSRRSAHRYLQQILEAKLLAQEGSGKNTRFKLIGVAVRS